ncbi:MAG: PilZ domain-containing protein [Oligoflexales bacterium]
MEKRQSVRRVLTGYVPGSFYDSQGAPLEYVLYDVSEKGLGVFFDPGPDEGDTVLLKLKRNKPGDFEFTVQWIVKDIGLEAFPEMQNMRRCGLLLTTPKVGNVDLVQIFIGLDGVVVKS